MTLAAGTERRLEQAHLQLVASGLGSEAAAVARGLLREDPGLHPAVVLAAQAEFLAGRYEEAWNRLRPVVEELPDYTAAQLLFGRLAETLGDLPTAFRAFRRAAGASATAAARADTLRPRAVEILANRIRNALERGRTGAATQHLEELQSWAPGHPRTLGSAAEVARALGDAGAELEAIRALAAGSPADRELKERWGELELAAGEVRTGLQIFQELAASAPGDPDLADQLVRAKFLWRMHLMPPEVQELVEQPELTRGRFAALLYWLFPDVRYGHPEDVRIATDILDHPFRQEIVRVINLGVMEVDAELHQFHPERPLQRAETLTGLLAILRQTSPPPACLGEVSLVRAPSAGAVCEAAARCGLIPGPGDCLPSAGVSGRQAVEMARRAWERLGAR